MRGEVDPLAGGEGDAIGIVCGQRTGRLWFFALGLLFATACGAQSPTGATAEPKRDAVVSADSIPTAISISGTTFLPNINQPSQLTAKATFASGVVLEVTNLSTWHSSNLTVAAVSSNGSVTAVGPGVATINATYRGVVAGLDVFVPVLDPRN
jgi:hypothetical protein